MAFLKVKNRSILAKLLICLILSQAFLQNMGQFPAAVVEAETVYPGMLLRLKQPTINSFKKAMEEFLPHYFNVDAKFPEEFHYSFNLFFNLLRWKINWTDIKYTNADLDMADVKVDLEKVGDYPLLKVEFPALKYWEISAEQHVNFWFLPDYSHVRLVFKDFNLEFGTTFNLDDKGYLDPVIDRVHLNFGETYLYHDNPITAFFMHQVLYFGIVVIEDSVGIIGQYVFNHMLGPTLDKTLNHYKFPFYFPSLVRGQNTWDQFTLDFRNTQAPYISEKYIDFHLNGAIEYNGEGCELQADHMTFHEICPDLPDDMPYNCDQVSQLVVSESAATCWANKVAKSKLGYIKLNTQTVKDFWDDPNESFTTSSSFGKHFPIMEQKLGHDVPLSGFISFKDVQVIFGSFDTDVIFSYKLCLQLNAEINGAEPKSSRDYDRVKHKATSKGEKKIVEVIYDELDMVSSMKVSAKNDIVSIEMLRHQLYIDSKNPIKKAPIHNGMKLTPEEYREFVSQFGYDQNFIKKRLNSVYFKNGLNFPYNPRELKTSLEFKEKQMHVLIDVENDFAEFMEDELWDEDAKNHRQEIIDQIKK